MAIMVTKKSGTTTTRYTSANNVYNVTSVGNFNTSPAVVAALLPELQKIKEHLAGCPVLRGLLKDYETLDKGGEELAQQQIIAAIEKKEEAARKKAEEDAKKAAKAKTE